MEKRRQWYYRGSLKSCNYSCSYCPFSKQKGSHKQLEEDKECFFRFVEKIGEWNWEKGAVQVVPYGEALLYEYYWEGLANLSKNFHIEAVGAQSNFSFPAEKMLSVYKKYGGNFPKLRLWGTFHPEMTSVEEFVGQCRILSEKGISYCAGAVGVPGYLEQIRKLRSLLPGSVYLWINKMDGLGRNYTESEKKAFLGIDEYFELELAHHPAGRARCQKNYFVEKSGKMFFCNLSRKCIGNIYDMEVNKIKPKGNFAGERRQFRKRGRIPKKNIYKTGISHKDNEKRYSICQRKECSCYLSYCNIDIPQLFFFRPYPAFRIPQYPKAVFFDIDGTLLPEGQKTVSKRTAGQILSLSKHCRIFLATSLPYEFAERKTGQFWDILSGGVFGNGGMCTALGNEQLVSVDLSWMPYLKKYKRKYGYRWHVYQRGGTVYKVTIIFSGKLEGRVDSLLSDLQIPASCHVIFEKNYLQVTGPGTGKLKGILLLCRQFSYCPEDVAVFGNAENDMEMLHYFPHSLQIKAQDF